MLDRKGFLFTVTVFLVLTYILLSISVWVKSLEASEQSFSEFYKESNVELAIEQITPAKLGNVSYIMMNRALLRLNDHSIDNPVLAGPEDDQSQNVREALRELVVDGAAQDSHFEGSGIPAENSSLSAWATNLNRSLRSIGAYLSRFEVTDFNIAQTSIDKLDYSFKITLEMRDYTGTSAVLKTYPIANRIALSGLVDPALARESGKKTKSDSKMIYRQFFFNSADYPEGPASAAVKSISSGDEGQGWLYGPLALADSVSKPRLPSYDMVPEGDRSSYILVGTYDQISGLPRDIYEKFGGLIVTSDHGPSTNSCENSESKTFNALTFKGRDCSIAAFDPATYTGQPFIVAPDFDPISVRACPSLTDKNVKQTCVLFVNQYKVEEVGNDNVKKLSPGHIYDVEDIRDLVMCGYYVKSTKAPSYMQRLFPNPYIYNDTAYGIETFVIGNYANDYDAYDTNSRLDRELFNDSIEAVRIRGMPGCRDLVSCSTAPVTGIFAVGPDTMTEYGLGAVACEGTGCDQ